MKKCVFMLFCFALLYSCKTEQLDEEILFVDAGQKKMSDLIDDYSLIVLETLEDNLILDPTVVRFSERFVFILDRFSPSKSLYVFSHEGKYIGKVGSKGEGPGEYIMPHQFVVNEKQNKLYLRDMATNSMLVYSLDTFGFIEKLSIPFYATCFELLDDDHFIWYVNAGMQNQGDFLKHIQITDTQCTPISSLIDIMDMPQRGMYNVMSYFGTHDDEVFFHHPFSGEYHLCSLDNSEVIREAFSLKFENLQFPELDYIMKNRGSIVKSLEQDGYIQWCDVLKNSSDYLSYFGRGKNIYWGKYDIESASGWYVKLDDLEDDMGIGSLSRPKTKFHDYFVSFISLEDVDWEQLPEQSVLKQYIKNKHIGGNPAILLYR